ncbi:MAG: DUF4956 domain-containing protein [Bacteroidota bacterium]
MGVFEPYLEEFSQSINLSDFLVNIIVAAVLCLLLRLFYVRHANTVSNRNRFAGNFLLLGLTTMLIITIVKSSVALSLGLVGALSIVRFRAAIKDPEELTYLFLVIGIGLAAGANQPLIAILAFAIIVGLLYLNKKLAGRVSLKQDNRMYLNISTDVDDMTKVANVLKQHLPYVELKRVDTLDAGLDLSFIVKANSIDELESVKQSLKTLSPSTKLSMVDQPDLVI